MPALEAPKLISVADYLRGELESDVKHEYLGGVVYAMAGATNRHNRIKGDAYAALHARLRGGPCEPFDSDTKVRVKFATHARFYYPDVSVVCHKNPPGDSYQDHPMVIVEVISPSTRRTDEGEKRDAYLTIPTLDAYLLIEQDQPRVTAYHRGERGFEAVVYNGLDAVIPLEAIGVDLPLAEVYEGVSFTHVEGNADTFS